MNDYTTYDDYELLILLNEKEPVCEQAFEVIWNRYSKKLRQFCYLNSKNKEDAKDLFQNTWIKFYEFVMKEKKIKSIKFYLHKIAFNIQWKIKEDIKLEIDYVDSYMLDEFIDENNNFLDDFEYQEIVSKFNITINYLDSKSKEILLLYWIGGLNFKEISMLYNESYDSIRMRCNRAIQKVLPLLEINLKNNNI